MLKNKMKHYNYDSLPIRKPKIEFLIEKYTNRKTVILQNINSP